MAKYPAPGRVKTRLAAALGEELACDLQRAFLLDLADRLRTLPCATTWAFWPAEAPFTALVPHARCRPQSGRDLGERMAAVVAAEFAEGGGPVVVLGADVPHVDLAWIQQALAALVDRADVVVGPALDGGYYLIGVRSPVSAIFADIAWGTSGVLAATLDRARGLGLVVELLPETFDVDEVTDLTRLGALLKRGEGSLPRTQKVLASLPIEPKSP